MCVILDKFLYLIVNFLITRQLLVLNEIDLC